MSRLKRASRGYEIDRHERRADQRRHDARARTGGERMAFILWLIAVFLVIAGIVALVRGQVAYGVILIVVGLLVGPGGVSVFT
jgi:hypothetical protein